ncbi:unnamed protein product, partial [marine sediment metagenome]
WKEEHSGISIIGLVHDLRVTSRLLVLAPF